MILYIQTKPSTSPLAIYLITDSPTDLIDPGRQLIVEIAVIMSMDEESERALEHCFKAAHKLFELHGIKAYVVPFNTWVTQYPRYSLMGLDLPITMINGEIIASGRAPSVDEIIEYILTQYRLPSTSQELNSVTNLQASRREFMTAATT